MRPRRQKWLALLARCPLRRAPVPAPAARQPRPSPLPRSPNGPDHDPGCCRPSQRPNALQSPVSRPRLVASTPRGSHRVAPRFGTAPPHTVTHEPTVGRLAADTTPADHANTVARTASLTTIALTHERVFLARAQARTMDILVHPVAPAPERGSRAPARLPPCASTCNAGRAIIETVQETPMASHHITHTCCLPSQAPIALRFASITTNGATRQP